MSDNKTVANTNSDCSRIFGGWTDIIILAIAITPSALLFYEITKIKKQYTELEARLAKIEQIVYYKNTAGEMIPISNLIMGVISDRSENNKTIEQLKKDNAKLIKQIGILSKRVSSIQMSLNQSMSTSRVTDLSSSKRSGSSQQIRTNKGLFIPQQDYTDELEDQEEEENPEDDFINNLNEEVI